MGRVTECEVLIVPAYGARTIATSRPSITTPLAGYTAASCRSPVATTLDRHVAAAVLTGWSAMWLFRQQSCLLGNTADFFESVRVRWIARLMAAMSALTLDQRRVHGGKAAFGWGILKSDDNDSMSRVRAEGARYRGDRRVAEREQFLIRNSGDHLHSGVRKVKRVSASVETTSSVPPCALAISCEI